jgi:hypothetical protein
MEKSPQGEAVLRLGTAGGGKMEDGDLGLLDEDEDEDETAG